MLATLAEAGISQAAIDVIDNVNGTFEGDIGDNNNGVADIVYTDLFLDDITVQNTLDAIISSQTVPSGASVITNVAGLSSITAGTNASPNVYVLVGDFTITSDIDVPSNVHIYLIGSITYVGSYTTPDIFNNGSGESENREEAIFSLSGSRNVKLIGIDNAQLIGNPNLASSNPHVNGVLIRFSGSTNVEVAGFEMRALWQGVTADFGTSNITVKNNYIVDSVKRGIWFLGTTDSVATHNFVENSGADGIDFDAFVADSVAYENVLLGNGRFAFFVEEGANNNFSVRQVSVLQRMGNPNQFRADGSSRFMLGNASNGTGNFFVNNNPGLVTRDNFFIDNTTFQPSSQFNNQGGRFIATGDNLQVGNSYFYGNLGYGIPDITPENFNNRDVTVKAIYAQRLPTGEITTASNSRTSFNSYDLTELLNQWDATLGNGDRPIRAEIAALPPALQVFQESDGQVVIEAENFTGRVAGTGVAAGKTFNLLHDDSAGGRQGAGETASGDLGLIAEFNESNLASAPSAGANVGDSLIGPRVDYDVNFGTPGIYRVFVRLRAPIANDNSLHVGLNGSAVTLGGSGLGVFGTDWDWVDDVVSGTPNITVNVPSAGVHTINLWMREDGIQVDKIVLDQSGVVPTGFGPAQSPIISSSPPTVASFARGGNNASGGFDGSGLTQPNLAGPLSFTFSEDVSVDAADLTVSNISSPGTNINLTGLSFNYDASTFTATWDFGSLAIPLPSSFYDVQLVSASIAAVDSGILLDGDSSGVAGGPFSQTLYVALLGDTDLDGVVDRNDLATVNANIGVANPTWANGDFDDDGQVEVSDVNLFTRGNSGDVAVTLANLFADLRPPVQIPAANVMVDLPAVRSELSNSVTDNEAPAIIQRPAPTSDDANTTAGQPEPITPPKVVGGSPIKPPIAAFEDYEVELTQSRPQNFDAQAAVIGQLTRRETFGLDSVLKAKLKRRLNDVGGLAGAVESLEKRFIAEAPETQTANATARTTSFVADRLFAAYDELHEWSS